MRSKWIRVTFYISAGQVLFYLGNPSLYITCIFFLIIDNVRCEVLISLQAHVIG